MREERWDVIVVGGGPAGLTAALYLGRAKCRVLVLEKTGFGGQIALTREVVNYPGVETTGGWELAETMRRQAEAFGAQFRMEEAVGFDFSGTWKTVRTDRGEYRCLGVLLATGAQPRAAGFRGEETYKGRGVAYCATCDGEFFAGKEVFVVGGGYAAAEESVFLTRFARHVTILIRKGDFSCAASVAERAKKHGKITVLTHTVLEEVAGENGLTYARYRNTATGEVTEYESEETFGVFVLAGYAPAAQAVKGLVELDGQGCIVTDAGKKTGVDGVYAAGDVCAKPLRQVVTATSDGALAAAGLERYVAELREKAGLVPEEDREPTGTPEKPRGAGAESGSFDAADRKQLEAVFEKMDRSLVLELELDDRPVSAELERFVTALAALTPKLKLRTRRGSSHPEAPWVRVLRDDGEETGLAFHGVPGGHETASFVLGLYNAAGPGQPLEEELRKRIAAISVPTELKILVTLSCGMCPDLVTAAQRVAAENPLVTAHVYDAAHFPALRERWKVMSVPCLIVNGGRTSFGKKTLPQLLELLES